MLQQILSLENLLVAVISIAFPVILNSMGSRKSKNKNFLDSYLNDVLLPIYEIIYDKKAEEITVEHLREIKKIQNDSFLLSTDMQKTLFSNVEKSFNSIDTGKKYAERYYRYKAYIEKWFIITRKKLGYPVDSKFNEFHYDPDPNRLVLPIAIFFVCLCYICFFLILENTILFVLSYVAILVGISIVLYRLAGTEKKLQADKIIAKSTSGRDGNNGKKESEFIKQK